MSECGAARRSVTTFAVALLLPACVPMHASQTERVAGADDLIEHVGLDPTTQPLTHVDVALAHAASVLVMYVVPGRGAAVIYPAPGAQAAPMSAGSHRIALTTPSMTRALRRATSLGSLGELLVVATDAPFDDDAVRAQLSRTAIATDAREAVSDAARAVRAAAPGARWSALTVRAWLLPSNAHTRGLLRMSGVQRGAVVF